MRYIRKIGVWPVGFAGLFPYQSPVVVNGKVRDWFSAYKRTQRKFPIDMAGFAITGELLMTHPNAKFNLNEPLGFMETKFIESLGVTMDDLEPRADNCTKVGRFLGEIHGLLLIPEGLKASGKALDKAVCIGYDRPIQEKGGMDGVMADDCVFL